MNVSDKGIAALIAHEGIVPAPYMDSVGVWTYGVGHTRAAGRPIPEDMARGMPDNMDKALRHVFEVFQSDLARYARDVERAVKVPMKQHEFDAAVSFHFNTGAINRASWVKHWNAGNKKAAAKAMMNWRRPKSIIPRRRAERDLFVHGRYPRGGATVWRVTQSGRVSWTPERTLTRTDILVLMQRPRIIDHVPKPPKPKKRPWWAFWRSNKPNGGER